MALCTRGCLIEMARNPGEMIDDARTVNGVRTAEQKRRSRRHVHQAPRTIVDAPCRLTRFHAIGQQPCIGNLCSDGCTFAAIGRRGQITQPIKSVNIVGQRRLKRELVIIQPVERLFKTLIMEFAHAQRLPAPGIAF